MATHEPTQATLTHSAALSLEERALLAPIVDDLTDRGAREAYNRWLESRGDKRLLFAQLLASYVDEFHGSSDSSPRLYADDSGYARAWTNMLGYPLFREFGRHGSELWEVRDIVLRHARPRLRITPEVIGSNRHSIHGSRFGGRASLPADVDWPTCSAGSMQFLAQIALSEIELTQVARELPSSGWLSFFAYDEWGTVGAGSMDDDPDTRVIYVPGDQELVWRDAPKDVVERSGDAPPTCRLIFGEEWDLPDESDLAIAEADQARLQEGERARQFSQIPEARHDYGCHLLGYSRHFRTSDPAPGPEWRNLLCLSSVSALGWNWCDGEHLAVFVPSDALAKGSFERVFGYAS